MCMYNLALKRTNFIICVCPSLDITLRTLQIMGMPTCKNTDTQIRTGDFSPFPKRLRKCKGDDPNLHGWARRGDVNPGSTRTNNLWQCQREEDRAKCNSAPSLLPRAHIPSEAQRLGETGSTARSERPSRPRPESLWPRDCSIATPLLQSGAFRRHCRSRNGRAARFGGSSSGHSKPCACSATRTTWETTTTAVGVYSRGTAPMLHA